MNTLSELLWALRQPDPAEEALAESAGPAWDCAGLSSVKNQHQGLGVCGDASQHLSLILAVAPGFSQGSGPPPGLAQEGMG